MTIILWHSMTSLWYYYRDEVNDAATEIVANCGILLTCCLRQQQVNLLGIGQK